MSAKDHQKQAGNTPVTVAIVTVSDTRTPETDGNKQYLEARLTELGHRIAAYRLIKDEPDQVETVLDELAEMPTVQIILFNGGTGIAPRDTTYDVVSRKLTKVLPGFGELFRMVSYDEVGAAAMLSRAIGGVYGDKLVFCMPGSTNAVQTAMEKLIIPQMNHLAWEIKR
ncbi:MAG: molybdenum cofactor biosynthesis protein [Phototrophicales bacterium]|nr:MAG: molybdenum cofactor biosynthesis protein [Phototrophicales bacterium]RMG74919.1 MAG: molybdenum cofactor biosynthesis protein MoaB [Chloroflexota bacterium]